MPHSRHPSPIKKRELTVFDLPPIGTPQFPTHVRKPSTTVFHRTNHHHGNGNNNNNLRTSNKTKVVHTHKAHFRLRELTESQIGPTRTLTDSELNKIAVDYLSNRSKSTDSWFQQRQRFIYQQSHEGKPKTVRDASTQLSILPPITSKGEPILRRPTVLQSKSMPEDGDFFKVILKNKELMPFSFQGDLKMARDFYARHYPLLMRKMMDVSPPNSRRVSFVTEEMVREIVSLTSAERRSLKLEARSAELEDILRGLEEDDEDGIVTELHHDVFNPLLWSYNLDKS